jgi:hypothetical protein
MSGLPFGFLQWSVWVRRSSALTTWAFWLVRPHRVALWLGGLGSWGRIGSGCVPSHSFTWSLGTAYVSPFHRLTVNWGQMPFGAVWCILSTISTIVCHWCNTLVLPWYGAGVVLVLLDPSSQLFEKGCFCACFRR